MGIVAFAIIASFAVIIVTGILMQRGWKIVIFDDGEECEKEIEDVEVEEEQSPRKTGEYPPGSVCHRDIEVGDTVYIETKSGSRYRFTLKDASLNLYHLEGRSVSKKQTFSLDVLVPNPFVPDRRLIFWSSDKTRDFSTSAIVRILIDKPPAQIAV